MKSARCSSWHVTVVAVLAVAGIFGLSLSGCGKPAPEPQEATVEQPRPADDGSTAAPETDTAGPEMPAPEETAAPELAAPELAAPTAAAPGNSDAANSDAANSDAANSDAANSDAANSDAANSDTAKSDAAKSDAAETTSPAPETVAETAAAPEAKAEAATVDVDPSKVSTYAPAEDLVRQFDEYLEDMEKATATEEEYEDSKSNLTKHANTLIIVSLGLGLHDQDNQYKKAAPALVEASRQLAAATDYESAKAGVEAIKEAKSSTAGDPESLGWIQVASLAELMKEVPLVDSRLKRYMRGSRFKSQADTSAGLASVLAVIAQGSMANASETEKPEEVEKWHALCDEMRDAAAHVRAAVRAQDQEAADKAMNDLHQSCENCHIVFHPEQVGVVVE